MADPDPNFHDQRDAADRTKYRRCVDSYVPPMISAQARAATSKLVTRDNVIPDSA